MTRYAKQVWFARVFTVSGKLAVPAVLLLLIATAAAPNASAGALWAGIGAPIPYVYTPLAVYGAPTLVYQPYYYYFGIYPYYGYARDYSYFYNYSPFWVNPWVWGFWDPPANPQITDTIQYAEIFAGNDGSGNPIPLAGLNVTGSDIISDVDGHSIAGNIINGTADQLIAAIDPSDRSRVADLLSGYVGTGDQFSAALYTVQIQDVAQQAPEPASLSLFGAGGVLLTIGCCRRRRRKSP